MGGADRNAGFRCLRGENLETGNFRYSILNNQLRYLVTNREHDLWEQNHNMEDRSHKELKDVPVGYNPRAPHTECRRLKLSLPFHALADNRPIFPVLRPKAGLLELKAAF